MKRRQFELMNGLVVEEHPTHDVITNDSGYIDDYIIIHVPEDLKYQYPVMQMLTMDLPQPTGLPQGGIRGPDYDIKRELTNEEGDEE